MNEEGAKIEADFKPSRQYTFYGFMKAQSFCGGDMQYGCMWSAYHTVGEVDYETFQKDVNCTIMVMCGWCYHTKPGTFFK